MVVFPLRVLFRCVYAYIDIVLDRYAVMMDMSMKIADSVVRPEQHRIMSQVILLMVEFNDGTYIIKIKFGTSVSKPRIIFLNNGKSATVMVPFDQVDCSLQLSDQFQNFCICFFILRMHSKVA